MQCELFLFMEIFLITWWPLIQHFICPSLQAVSVLESVCENKQTKKHYLILTLDNGVES